MNKVDKLCVECKNNNCSISTYFNIYLCSDCKSNDKYTLVTKTNAKKNYFLKDEDLDKIDKIVGKSAFTTANLIKYLCDKHNLSPDHLDEYIIKLINQRNSISNNRKKKIN